MVAAAAARPFPSSSFKRAATGEGNPYFIILLCFLFDIAARMVA